jgi:chemotaxis protein histidine kinase CheA/CheY-like chemotaxis protein
MPDDFDRSAILGSFLDEVSAYLPQIGADLDRLQQAPDDQTALEDAHRCVHTIAGSAALMTYRALAQIAHGMEQTLEGVLAARRSVDAPTLGLLRRSFGRLTRVVEQIRTGGSDTSLNSFVAEDDSDRRAWRGPTGAPATTSTQGRAEASSPSYAPGAPVPDWLAAFADPDPALGGQGGNGANGTSRPAGGPPSFAASGAHNAWAASLPTQANASAPSASGNRAGNGSGNRGAPTRNASDAAIANADTAVVPQWRTGANSATGGNAANGAGDAMGATGPQSGPPPGAVDELRADAEAVRRQVATLRDIVLTLRDAAQTMEGERTELRGFLDGSKDALDRLEEWAGRQMGLDLAGSPEAVRRYLPLSVIWVTTTRLKRLVGLLHNTGRDLTVSEEQIQETVTELRSAIEAAASLTSGIAAAPPSWQPAWTPPAVAPAGPGIVEGGPPSGGLASLAPGARAELERQVREDLRRALEDEVRDEIAVEVRRDEEHRLRHELEIEVRRQFLAQMAPGLGTNSAITGVSQAIPQLSAPERGPRQVQVTSEQSPEALEVFRDEALEHLQTITTGIAQLERKPGDVEALRAIRRAMHTLKGAAGMMGFTAIQTLAHASEDLLERLADRAIAFSLTVMSLIIDTSEALDQLVSGRLARPEDQQKLVQKLLDRYAAVTGTHIAAPTVPTPATRVRGKPTNGPARSGAANQTASQGASQGTGAEVDLSVRLQLSKLDELVNLFGEVLVNRSILEERITRMSALIGDAVIASERLRDIGGQIETRFEAATLPSGRPSGGLPSPGGANYGAANYGAANYGRSDARPAAAQPPSYGGTVGRGRQPAHAGEFDELELDRYTEFHRLSRGLSESVTDVVTLSHELEALVREVQTSFIRENRLSSDFQDRLLKARLVPLTPLVARLYRAVRGTALAEGKEVEFFEEGAETEVDRKVIEEVEGPLLHLVRNAVSHGIEAPKARARAGKPRAGRVVVSASYEGNQVVISVRDDGAGIDPERIRSVAAARGWIDRHAQLSERDAINLIFQPGVTTATSVTEQSGRGVGLDVVRDVVSHLRGTVEVDSRVGQGTVFTMKFPISLQIARAVLVRAGPQTVAIPMAVVEQIGRLDYYQRAPGQPPAIEVRGDRYPLVHLANYLNVPPGHVDDRSTVLLVSMGLRRVALLVDAIVNQQEIVRKPLGAHLRDVPGISGAAVLGNGQVVLILELNELLAQQPSGTFNLPEPGAAQIAMTPTAPLSGPPSLASVASTTSPPAPSRRTPGPARSLGSSTGGRVVVAPGVGRSYVLVVDDSPSVRRVVGNVLKSGGWEVQTARDGVEALELIARQRPAAVLLDIEMPRMDGYELMATIRSQEQYRTLPLIVLTSRAASKHHQRAMQLGADAYIIKPYQPEELLGTIARLVQERR